MQDVQNETIEDVDVIFIASEVSEVEESFPFEFKQTRCDCILCRTADRVPFHRDSFR